jgi:hypothetical protein
MTGVKSSIDYYINAFLTIAALRNILKNETARPLTIDHSRGSGFGWPMTAKPYPHPRLPRNGQPTTMDTKELHELRKRYSTMGEEEEERLECKETKAVAAMDAGKRADPGLLAAQGAMASIKKSRFNPQEKAYSPPPKPQTRAPDPQSMPRRPPTRHVIATPDSMSDAPHRCGPRYR